jgi:antitoxin component of MazEF toxin-antitoxin module
MGYPVKLQKVERPTNRSYYINLPTAVAEAIAADKGETFEWSIEDKNTLVLSRTIKRVLRTFRKKPGR